MYTHFGNFQETTNSLKQGKCIWNINAHINAADFIILKAESQSTTYSYGRECCLKYKPLGSGRKRAWGHWWSTPTSGWDSFSPLHRRNVKRMLSLIHWNQIISIARMWFMEIFLNCQQFSLSCLQRVTLWQTVSRCSENFGIMYAYLKIHKCIVYKMIFMEMFSIFRGGSVERQFY